MIGIRGFRHTAIVVRNLDLMLDFYVAVLGLQVIRRVELDSAEFQYGIAVAGSRARVVHLAIPGSDTCLELFEFAAVEAPEAVPPSNAAGYRHVAFIVDDMEEACQTLRASGLQMLSRPVALNEPGVDPNLLFMYFRDPEGNIIELNNVSLPGQGG